jgi:hypothetical protein
MSITTHARTAKLAGLGAVVVAALAAAPMSLAATSGGAGVTASAAQAKSAPFTLGLSSTTVTPGQKLTISGLAYARAGKNLTIMSPAISSSRTVARMPAVQTPALVEGIYRTTVRVPTNANAGVYPVILRFGNRQVASISNLRVVRPGASIARAGRRTTGCHAISFTVLNNDHAGSAYMPAGRYTVSSRNLDCGTASADFAGFLAGAGKQIPGWGVTSAGAGRATFTQNNSGMGFSVAKLR